MEATTETISEAELPAAIASTIERLRERRAFGIASAAKRGRNPKFPYVPVIKLTDENGNPAAGLAQTHQIQGLAYETRAEAVARAERHIEARYVELAEKLATPVHRALRQAYGLPREIVR